ncbi:metallophosphoesterase [Pelagicoccus sp. SDUM812005]|uniref:metallophosphoesterase n=1 Tax=Pelagicoccus sp. SDUM812005 TaxID=3041257 RepID=UPI00280CC74D|nr:metallophosphoesterase [Pelagicoccus sp. SDUM812005]MDQ8182841.1 sugar-binding protein [Pelagicoccus sp. SDUM812005]
MNFRNRFSAPALLLGTCALTGSLFAHTGHDHEPSTRASNLPRVIIEESDTVNPWTGLDLNNDPSNFQFAIITDNTTGGREGVLEDAFRKLNWLQPEFVMSVGDLIQGYTTDRKQLEYEWNEFEGFVDKLEMPFFYVAGNHDYTNPVMAEVWKERYGASYYSFVYHDVFCLVLNSNDEERPHAMTQEQVDWALAEIEKHPDPRWTMVFIHTPLWDREDPTGKWPQIEEALQGRDFTVFAGHHHRYVKHSRQGKEFYTLATTGGNSGLRGPRFGEFDHVVWVTMTDEGPILANLILEGIWDENVRDETVREVQGALIDDGSLALQPILYRSGKFDTGKLAFRFTNDSDYPVDFEMQIKQLENIVIKGERSGSWSLPPNEVLRLDYEVENASSDFAEGIAAEMAWKLAFDRDGEAIRFADSESLSVVRELPIRRERKLEVDGDLGEWDSLNYRSPAVADWHYHRRWEGEADSRFEFDLAEDGKALYVAVKVYDDSLALSAEDALWAQDSVAVQIDARPKAVRGTNASNRGPLLINVAPGLEGDTRARGARSYPEGTAYVARKTSYGYAVEISIPFQYLDAQGGGDWDGIRLNVTLNDKDLEKDAVARIFWRPSWNRDDAVPGAGSFYRKGK